MMKKQGKNLILAKMFGIGKLVLQKKIYYKIIQIKENL